jgi:uncharacterized membrane protein YdbT with pleckstrin-like domain
LSYIEKNLLPGEELVYRAHLHWVIYARAIFCFVLAIMIVLLVAVYGTPDTRTIGVLVALAFVVFGLFAFILRYIDNKTSEFGVTNKRVLIKVGLIRRHSLELLLRQIEGIGVDQSIMGRIFGYGTIMVSGTGGTKETFPHIAHPLEFRRQVQGQTIA